MPGTRVRESQADTAIVAFPIAFRRRMAMMSARRGPNEALAAGVPADDVAPAARATPRIPIYHALRTRDRREGWVAGAAHTEEADMARILGACLVVMAATLSACGASSATSSAAADVQKQADLYAIEHIEVTFHKAASTHDLDLMMSLWADDAVATIGGHTYSGKDEIRDLFATKAAPFRPENQWLSDTPAYKLKSTVNGDTGTLYFECHYIDVENKLVVVTLGAQQQVARIDGKWLIKELTSTSPTLSS
jgi:ketosteroid isomerase-like protein